MINPIPQNELQVYLGNCPFLNVTYFLLRSKKKIVKFFILNISDCFILPISNNKILCCNMFGL